jgi:hypothetical protein
MNRIPNNSTNSYFSIMNTHIELDLLKDFKRISTGTFSRYPWELKP